MELRVETAGRVRAYWRAWESQGGEPNAVSVVLIGRDRFVRIPDWLRPRVDTGTLTDLESLTAALGADVEQVVGEARLAYADASTLHLVAFGDVTEVGDDDPRLAALEAASTPSEWAEASAGEPSVCRLGIAHDGSLLSVAALRVWDDTIGHVSVFTAAHARGRGLARKVGSAVVAHAMTLGCVPQWRSRIGNDASARVADQLGFVAIGRQAFVRVRGRAEERS